MAIYIEQLFGGWVLRVQPARTVEVRVVSMKLPSSIQ
jgi:hypothetical protein